MVNRFSINLTDTDVETVAMFETKKLIKYFGYSVENGQTGSPRINDIIRCALGNLAKDYFQKEKEFEESKN